MPRFGTLGGYLCINKQNKVMKTTISNISSMFSSEESFKALVDMIDDMDLELLDVCFA